MKNNRKTKFFLFFSVIFVSFLILGFFLFFSKEEEDLPEKKASAEEIYPKNNEEKIEDLPLPKSSAALSVFYPKQGERVVLYEKDSKTPFPIASISKLMTAVIVLENYNLEEEIKIKESEIVSRTEFRDFKWWSETKIGDIIYPMLIESNNSAAFALALAGERFFKEDKEGVELFIEKMNEKAENIGMEKTYFVNPSGLDGKGEYNLSTVEDIAKLSFYILQQNKNIFEITTFPSFRLYSPDKLMFYEAVNTNDFLHDKNFAWKENIVGGKTGWTHAAYGCLLLLLEVPEEGNLVNVVLGAEDRFLEMEKLLNYVYNAYQF